MSDTKYPDIKVRLTGIDGNAFSIIGAVSAGLRQHEVPSDEIDKFREEAMSGDYDNVLQTCMKWVDVE